MMANKETTAKTVAPNVIVRSVWSHNLDYEFGLIQTLIHRYHYVSIDSEYPGVIFRPSLTAGQKPYHLRPYDNYNVIKTNVDALKLIQLGLTLSDSGGNLPNLGYKNQCFVWEFNFCDFNISCDLYARDSIELLQRQGINFERNRIYGVDSAKFAVLLAMSGLICNPVVNWVTFHGAYDFAFLMKILTRQYLPTKLPKFLEFIKDLFGNVYDLKHIIRSCPALYGGLDQVAKLLEVNRAVGKGHQAGSDSLLTCQTFQKIKEVYFVSRELEQYVTVLFGLEL